VGTNSHAVEWVLLKRTDSANFTSSLGLRFLWKLHGTPIDMNHQPFGAFFVLNQREKVSFSGLKKDFNFSL